MDNTNYYHVDPRTTRDDATGRYPRNFVTYPWFLKPVEWGDALSKLLKGRPAYLFGDSLLNVFDQVHAPAVRWGSTAELEVLRHALSVLSRDADNNPYLSPIGRVLLKAMLNNYLKNRASTIRFYETNREYIEAHGRFTAPLIVTGLFRTGTTLLQRLLSEDPNTRSPYMYELETTIPPLKAGDDPMKDPRIRKSATTTALFSRLAPGFWEKVSESHLFSPTEPEESLLYMQFHNGLSLTHCLGSGREYFRVMHEPRVADPLLKYERNFFTMLDAYRPAKSHWTLKAPSYAAYFGKIFDYYPDARVIVTHRHPSKNIASVCRMLESTSSLPFDVEGSFDKQRFGSMIQEQWTIFLSRPQEFRMANPQCEPQIFDCMYQELMHDPIAMVKRIYEKFDLDYSPEFERRMKRYLQDNQQGKHGRHRYSNEEYGIDPHHLYRRNRPYFDRYGFAPEASHFD